MHDGGNAAIRHRRPDVIDRPANAQRARMFKVDHDIRLRQCDFSGMWLVQFRWKRDVIMWLGHGRAPSGIICFHWGDPDGKKTAGKAATPCLAKVERRLITTGEGRDRVVGMHGVEFGQGIVVPVEHRHWAGHHHQYPCLLLPCIQLPRCCDRAAVWVLCTRRSGRAPIASSRSCFRPKMNGYHSRASGPFQRHKRVSMA